MDELAMFQEEVDESAHKAKVEGYQQKVTTSKK